MSLDSTTKEGAQEVIRTLRAAGFEEHAIAAEAALEVAVCDADREAADPGRTEACWSAMTRIHERFATVAEPFTNSDLLALVEDSIDDVEEIRASVTAVPLIVRNAALKMDQALTVMALLMDKGDPTAEISGTRGQTLRRFVEAMRCSE